jgi:integrative and conjugative element protein (TIGR02256 family)
MTATNRSNAPRILISRSALDTIAHEVQRIGELPETGGVLAGRRLNDRDILIVAATGPGPRADHQRHTFAPDTKYANQRLRELHEEHEGADYVGVWHKHPPDLDRPSSPDWEQAKEILLDPDYAMDEIVAPIVVVRDGTPHVKVYYARKDDLGRGDFIPVEHEEMSPAAAQERLQQAGEEKARGYRERLGEELGRLRSQHDVTEKKRLDDGSLVFVVQSSVDSSARMYLICPASYPQAPPRALVEQNNEQKDFDSTVTAAWTEDRYLADVVEEAENWLREGKTEALSLTNDPVPLRRTALEPELDRTPLRPEFLVVGGIGAVLATLLCVVLMMVLQPTRRRNDPTEVARVSTTPDLEQAPPRSHGTQPAPLTLTPPAQSTLGALAVTLVPTFNPNGTGVIVFQVVGGEPPYTCSVNGQKIVGDTYEFLWQCGQDLGLTYEVIPSDGKRAKMDSSLNVPTCTPTSTPQHTNTPMPSPTATHTPTPIPTQTLRVTNLLRAYNLETERPYENTRLVLNSNAAKGFWMHFTLTNDDTRSVHILDAGTSVLRNEQNLRDMFQRGTFDLQGGMLAPGETVEIWVRERTGPNAIIYWFDLYRSEDAQHYNIQLTDTLTLRPAVCWSWDKYVTQSECQWMWIEGGGSVTVQYQQ